MATIRKKWLSFLDQHEIDSIHQTSLQVLTEIGVRIEDPELNQKLQDCGCRLKEGKVLFTADIIDSALKKLPHDVIFSNRQNKRLHLKEGHVFTHPGGSIPGIFDLDSGQKRDATLADLRDLIRLMNTLENLDLSGALVCPLDVSEKMSEVRQFEMLFRYAHKTISGPGVSSVSQAAYILELYQTYADALPDRDGLPLMDVGISPESPLYYPQAITDIMKIFIAAGIPIKALIAPIAGLSGPMTIAGCLVQMNASMLAFVTMAHLINPQTPIIYGARVLFANMHTGLSVGGLPETGVAGACSVQLARHYGLPSDVYGLSSSSSTFDNQLGYENAINGILPLLAGANIISGFGGLTSGLMSAFEQLVIDNEVFAMLLKAAQGVIVSPDRLALESIAKAMHGETFLEQEHTLTYLRQKEVLQPRLSFNGLWSEWEAQGFKDIHSRARDEVHQRLNQHEDIPLPTEAEREFGRIIAAAET